MTRVYVPRRTSPTITYHSGSTVLTSVLVSVLVVLGLVGAGGWFLLDKGIITLNTQNEGNESSKDNSNTSERSITTQEVEPTPIPSPITIPNPTLTQEPVIVNNTPQVTIPSPQVNPYGGVQGVNDGVVPSVMNNTSSVPLATPIGIGTWAINGIQCSNHEGGAINFTLSINSLVSNAGGAGGVGVLTKYDGGMNAVESVPLTYTVMSNTSNNITFKGNALNSVVSGSMLVNGNVGSGQITFGNGVLVCNFNASQPNNNTNQVVQVVQ